MTEKVGYIRNSLTIIAIFAGLAEVGGTIVLPVLRESTQEKYVWFLMLFPTFLVAVFFWVLFKKHYVLYAPSDYRDDSTFRYAMQTAMPASSVKSLETSIKKLALEIDGTPSDKPSFIQLRPETRKVIKTLWQFQKKEFPTNTNRWGFGVRLGAPDYAAFSLGVLESLKYDLIAIDARGLCFLSDTGFSYCEKYNSEISGEVNFYSEFMGVD